MRFFSLAALLVASILTGCSDPQPPAPKDPTTTSEYRDSIKELVTLNRQANDAFNKGKPDDASGLVQKGEPIESNILAPIHPTLAAMEAASDLDDLYGRMLLSNKHYEWAQFEFQKNLGRWKHWVPETPDTVARLKRAEEQIAECDKGMFHK